MINVLKYKYITAFFSLLIAIAFFGVAAYRYTVRGHAFSWSVDFTGGFQGLYKFDKPVSPLMVKDILDKEDLQGAVVRQFGDQELLVRVREFSGNAQAIGEKIQQTLTSNLKDVKVTLLQSEYVGSAVGKALQAKSWWAIVLALIAMLAYIAIRFWSVAFAVGAVVALFHDALIMLATFLFLDREISVNVIGSILAVLGYSVNDTIVIFSQIRDNLATMKNSSLETVINLSINQTLKRTLLTSISTGLVVGAMFFFGGEALRDFSLALLVGIVFGTYSSIYIASPVMMLLYKKE